MNEQPKIIREVAIRYTQRRFRVRGPVRDPDAAVELARQVVEDDAREHFLAIYLDGRHAVIGLSVVSVGTATASLIHPREVFQPAVLLGAVAVIVLHNHPSGDPSPSAEDHAVAKRLAEAGRLLGIELLDAIVWTRGGPWFSTRASRPADLSDRNPASP